VLNDGKSGGDGPMKCGPMNVSVMSVGRFAGAQEGLLNGYLNFFTSF